MCPIRFAFIFTRAHLLRGGLIELEQIDSETHRWLSMAFTVAVIINIIAIAQKSTRTRWAYWAVVPLALQFFTGLYLFVLPYATKRRERRTAEGAAFHVHLATINVMSSDCSWELNLRA